MQSISAPSQRKSASSRIESNALLTSSTRSFTRRNSASLRAARSPRSTAPCNDLSPSSVGFPHDVVAIERTDDFLSLAAGVPADHHVDLRLAGNAFPLLPPELDPPVAELVGALAQERDAAVEGHLLPHGPIQSVVPATEQLLILLSTGVPSCHDRSQDPRADYRRNRYTAR